MLAVTPFPSRAFVGPGRNISIRDLIVRLHTDFNSNLSVADPVCNHAKVTVSAPTHQLLCWTIRLQSIYHKDTNNDYFQGELNA
jgi:hypothetical protein